MQPWHHVCSSCAAGKLHQDPFPSQASSQAQQALELIHANLAGPLEVPSIGGSRYYMLLIDDFSRMCWVFFLSKKSEALSHFERWIAFIEKQTRHKVQTLRTKNGGEFVAFQDFLASSGIEHQTTIPYSPQQNGVAERKNCTVKEMARTLLHHAQCPSNFWAEAIATSIYLLNRSTTKALDGMTPFKAFTGHKPGVRHLRVFDCIAHVHVPKSKRRTLDAKSTPMIFTGYAIGSKGYRFYDPSKKDIILSRDAKFDEHSFDASHTASPSSNPTLHDPFPSLEIHPLISPPPSTSSTSSHLPSTSKQPPKWVRTLLQNFGLPPLDAHASWSRKQRSPDTINVALMAHVYDIYELDTIEEALALPQWKDAMQEEYARGV